MRRLDSALVASRFRGAPWRTRAFLWARWLATPYMDIVSRLPERGEILDIGCGFGLLGLAAAVDNPKRSILGVDHDEGRIALARKLGAGLEHVAFRVGDFSVLTEERHYAAITLIDVLHYLDLATQVRVLALARARLHDGGVLVFRQPDADATWRAALTIGHERLMTGLGWTRADALHLRSRREWIDMAQAAGFQVAVGEPAGLPYADLLFVCYPDRHCTQAG